MRVAEAPASVCDANSLPQSPPRQSMTRRIQFECRTKSNRAKTDDDEQAGATATSLAFATLPTCALQKVTRVRRARKRKRDFPQPSPPRDNLLVPPKTFRLKTSREGARAREVKFCRKEGRVSAVHHANVHRQAPVHRRASWCR